MQSILITIGISMTSWVWIPNGYKRVRDSPYSVLRVSYVRNQTYKRNTIIMIFDIRYSIFHPCKFDTQLYGTVQTGLIFDNRFDILFDILFYSIRYFMYLYVRTYVNMQFDMKIDSRYSTATTLQQRFHTVWYYYYR